MSLYYILNDRFGTPMIEKQKAVGFAGGLVEESVKSLSESGGQDKGYSKKFAAIFARQLAKVRKENGPASNAIHRARGFAEGFGEGFALVRAEQENDGIDGYQEEHLDKCLNKIRLHCRAAGVADAFDKGLTRGEKRAAKLHAANSLR